MKNLVTFIKEAQIEDFMGSIISLFSMMSYVQETKYESIKSNIDLLVYVILDNKIMFTIGDNAIYGTLIMNEDNTINLNFRSILPKDDFNVTPFENYSQDEMYLIMSNGTIRDLLNSSNKRGFIKSLSGYYKPEELIDKSDRFEINVTNDSNLEI